MGHWPWRNKGERWQGTTGFAAAPRSHAVLAGQAPDKWDFIQAVANAPVGFNNYSGSCAGAGTDIDCDGDSADKHSPRADGVVRCCVAGSGDFHMYRQWRRKEFSRLAQMDRDSKEVPIDCEPRRCCRHARPR